MRRTTRVTSAAAIALVGSWVGTAQAVPMTWQDSAGTPWTLVAGTTPYSYQHDITDGPDGFRPGIDSVHEAQLQIRLADDRPDIRLPFLGWIGDAEETVGFRFDNGTWITSVVDGIPLPLLWQQFDFTVTSMLTDGRLNVSIFATAGDFFFGSSHLLVTGDRATPATNVPEPTMLSLFGVGLLAMGFAARRRRPQ